MMKVLQRKCRACQQTSGFSESCTDQWMYNLLLYIQSATTSIQKNHIQCTLYLGHLQFKTFIFRMHDAEFYAYTYRHDSSNPTHINVILTVNHKAIFGCKKKKFSHNQKRRIILKTVVLSYDLPPLS